MKILLILSLVSLSFNAASQCCPYINNIEVIPGSPTTADSINIVTTVTTPNQGMFLYSSHSVNGSVIEIEACYYSGLFKATQTFYDTLNIGFLSAGNYTVEFTAYESIDTAACTFTDTMTLDTTFTVTSTPAGLGSISKELGKLYPNPSNGSFTIELPEEIQATNIQIRSISGEVLKQMEFSERIDLNLAAGMYLIEFLEKDIRIGYKRFMIN